MATKQATSEQPSRIYHIKITLSDSKPEIWRRLEIESSTKLDKASTVLLRTMGWEGYHLHQFIVGRTYYSMPDPDGYMEVLDERKYTLADILPKEKSKCVYEYDFGDGWIHDIAVEKITEPEAGVKYPRCTAGKMACPPEDSGGVWGYTNLVEILKDPEHDEHETFVEWLGLESGEEFDPKEFDLADVNKRLKAR